MGRRRKSKIPTQRVANMAYLDSIDIEDHVFVACAGGI